MDPAEFALTRLESHGVFEENMFEYLTRDDDEEQEEQEEQERVSVIAKKCGQHRLRPDDPFPMREMVSSPSSIFLTRFTHVLAKSKPQHGPTFDPLR
jgi:hypothetical protein